MSTDPVGAGILHGLFALGWLAIPLVSLMIDHFDLFGTRQVWLHLRGREYTPRPFRTPGAYRFVRHPLYVGWLLAFWATPTMSISHLVFAGLLTAYIVLAIPLEERDLVDALRRAIRAVPPIRRRAAAALPTGSRLQLPQNGRASDPPR